MKSQRALALLLLRQWAADHKTPHPFPGSAATVTALLQPRRSHTLTTRGPHTAAPLLSRSAFAAVTGLVSLCALPSLRGGVSLLFCDLVWCAAWGIASPLSLWRLLHPPSPPRLEHPSGRSRTHPPLGRDADMRTFLGFSGTSHAEPRQDRVATMLCLWSIWSS